MLYKLKRNFSSGWLYVEGNFNLCDAGIEELVCGESYKQVCSETVSLRLLQRDHQPSVPPTPNGDRMSLWLGHEFKFRLMEEKGNREISDDRF